jgi:hypothetical protein
MYTPAVVTDSTVMQRRRKRSQSGQRARNGMMYKTIGTGGQETIMPVSVVQEDRNLSKFFDFFESCSLISDGRYHIFRTLEFRAEQTCIQN